MFEWQWYWLIPMTVVVILVSFNVQTLDCRVLFFYHEPGSTTDWLQWLTMLALPLGWKCWKIAQGGPQLYDKSQVKLVTQTFWAEGKMCSTCPPWEASTGKHRVSDMTAEKNRDTWSAVLQNSHATQFCVEFQSRNQSVSHIWWYIKHQLFTVMLI